VKKVIFLKNIKGVERYQYLYGRGLSSACPAADL
jgi:hypothetical protein